MPPISPTISLAMIARDEEENLARCLASVAPHVDQIVVVDTGSVDNTRAVATQYGASVHQFDHHNHPEVFFIDDEGTCRPFGGPPPYSGEIALGDFAAARNESFRHAACDYVLWLDADDVLDGAGKLREIVADMHGRGLQLAFLPYDYARDDKGRTFYRQWRERIFRRGLGQWVNPVHEVHIPHQPNPALTRYEAPLVVHCRKADRKTIPHRNFKNLLRQLKQVKDAGAPVDPRMLFYLGQEARFVDARQAVGFYNEYLQCSGWPEERAAAHVAIGSMLEVGMLGLPPADAYQQANREFATAAAEMPGNPDGVFGLARVAYLRQRWQDAINYSERGFAMGNPDSMLGANPLDRIYRPHVYYSYALAAVGRLDEAIASCKAGLAICPDDPGVPGGAPGMLKHNLDAFERGLRDRQVQPADAGGRPTLLLDKTEDVDAPPAQVPCDAAVIWSLQLWKQNIAAGDIDKAERLLDALPAAVQLDPVIGKMRTSTARRRARLAPIERRDVVLYLGPGVEHWDPTTPAAQGLGGSETAAIEMARHLAAAGRDVTVYAEAAGDFDGVHYVHHGEFRGADCAVFIASRAPWAIAQHGPVQAGLRLLWVHDVNCGPPSPQMEAWLYQYDRILCLSEWHKWFFHQTYPTLHPDQILVTRNGIDPARFAAEQPKQNRLVFSSSPNRGLPVLLHMLREVRKRVPDAHVDIFYGFETWETMAKAQGAQQQLQEIAAYRQLIAQAEADGIATFHGRRPQPELAAAFLRAKAWAYPTDFPETSCITAMEAQAAGCVPIATRFAALPETIKHGILVDPGPEYAQQFVDHIVGVLQDDTMRKLYADPAREWALASLAWAGVAATWLQWFDALPAQLAARPAPRWRAA